MASFRAKINDKWHDYSPQADDLLREAWSKGFPSVRFGVKGAAHKFDFKNMRQKNLVTREEYEMCKPLYLRDQRRPMLGGPRPVFVVRVPRGQAGKIIHVPHPKTLGKAMLVQVPIDARDGQVMFVPVPAQWKKKAKRSVGMAGGCTAGAAGGFVVAEEVGAAGLAAAGAGTAAVATPVLVGGLIVAGALAVGAGAVAVAKRYPLQFAAAGAVAVGVLALGDHVAEHGALETLDMLADGASALVEGTGEAAEDFMDFAEDAVDWGMETGGEAGTLLESIIGDLF